MFWSSNAASCRTSAPSTGSNGREEPRRRLEMCSRRVSISLKQRRPSPDQAQVGLLAHLGERALGLLQLLRLGEQRLGFVERRAPKRRRSPGRHRVAEPRVSHFERREPRLQRLPLLGLRLEESAEIRHRRFWVPRADGAAPSSPRARVALRCGPPRRCCRGAAPPRPASSAALMRSCSPPAAIAARSPCIRMARA